jgi:hypothetical protein
VVVVLGSTIAVMSGAGFCATTYENVFTLELCGPQITLAVVDERPYILLRGTLGVGYTWTEADGLSGSSSEDAVCICGSVSPEIVCKLASIGDVSEVGFNLMLGSLRSNGYIFAQRISLVLLEGGARVAALANPGNFVELKERCCGKIPDKVPLFGLVDGAIRYDAIKFLQKMVVQEGDEPAKFWPTKYFLFPAVIKRNSYAFCVC